MLAKYLTSAAESGFVSGSSFASLTPCADGDADRVNVAVAESRIADVAHQPENIPVAPNHPVQVGLYVVDALLPSQYYGRQTVRNPL